MYRKNTLACVRGLALLLLLCSNVAFAQRGAADINVNGQYVMAARAGQVGRVAALLDGGAQVNSRDRNGDSPLNMAAAKGNEAMAEVLLKAGADVNLANLAGVTPLMGASFSGKPELVRKLLAAGARIEPLDRVKKNAATYAAGTGCTECLADLVKAGTPINARLENDLTLLMWAAAYGHEATVRLLLAQGAERGLKDARGKTAAEMAREGNHLALAQLLEQP
ncbi:MAG: ankyrin repeat domain-containing protein [Hylemonella sp.]|nr:ankyrin repeat domain-containing protein [Hylemonella sp.]